MTLSVLISCMYQDDTNIIKKTNLQTDAVIVNQCDKNSIELISFFNIFGKNCKVLFINTSERGLSNSRNLAIKNSNSDICLLCDDDEILVDNYEEIILEGYKKYFNYEIIAFNIDKSIKKTKEDQIKKISYFDVGDISSVQISFKRRPIIEKRIFFDIKMGSGTGNGGGEENKFLIDSIRNDLSIIKLNTTIGKLVTSKSFWFNGFTKHYFKNLGWSSRRIWGVIYGYLHLWYIVISKFSYYRKELNCLFVIIYLHQGYFEKR